MLTSPDRTGDKGLSQAQDPSTCFLSSPCLLPTIQMCFQPWLPQSAAQNYRFCLARTQPMSKLLLNSHSGGQGSPGTSALGLLHTRPRKA